MYDADGNQKLKTNGGHFVFCPTSSECESYDRQKLGKSQFMFAFWPAGEISNWHTNKGVEPYLNGWNGKDESLYTATNFRCNKDSGANFFCTAVIQKNGWKIPKNYPFKVK